ncbi:hypothetical protein BKA56DRAFT_689241 [Ilyonectria sp. MPI-CAGE-AT-0026]|nr:hypothetical protein BKA56DRAFT_689241 [Ilyonectria sp. MPI-CAGE-AT-0026]
MPALSDLTWFPLVFHCIWSWHRHYLKKQLLFPTAIWKFPNISSSLIASSPLRPIAPYTPTPDGSRATLYHLPLLQRAVSRQRCITAEEQSRRTTGSPNQGTQIALGHGHGQTLDSSNRGRNHITCSSRRSIVRLLPPPSPLSSSTFRRGGCCPRPRNNRIHGRHAARPALLTHPHPDQPFPPRCCTGRLLAPRWSAGTGTSRPPVPVKSIPMVGLDEARPGSRGRSAVLVRASPTGARPASGDCVGKPLVYGCVDRNQLQRSIALTYASKSPSRPSSKRGNSAIGCSPKTKYFIQRLAIGTAPACLLPNVTPPSPK